MSENYLTVGALTKYLKKKFDVDPYLKSVFVKGEISNFKPSSGNWLFFKLKDQDAVIDIMCPNRLTQPIIEQLKDGKEILIEGDVSLYVARGTYNIIVKKIQLLGLGELIQQLEQLKRRLEFEGIFNLPKKKINRYPKRIAILTSENGSVVHDINETIKRRYPIVELHVYNAIVQGDHAAETILNSLERIKNSDYKYDTVIIARGGGSIEDLWVFNNEKIVRCIANYTIPVISSIGHATDTVLIDYVSDLSMQTPTAAAESATVELASIQLTFTQLQQRLFRSIYRHLNNRQKQFDQLMQSYIFNKSEKLYISYQQKMALLNRQLVRHMLYHNESLVRQLNQQLLKLRHLNPINQLVNYRQNLTNLQEKLQKNGLDILHQKNQKFELQVHKLDLLSPLKNMHRGYSIVSRDHEIIKSVHQLELEQVISIEFIDGSVQAQISAIEEKKR